MSAYVCVFMLFVTESPSSLPRIREEEEEEEEAARGPVHEPSLRNARGGTEIVNQPFG